MAITVSSTTDDQAAVNAAAGIAEAEPEAPEAARHPEKEKPQPTPAPAPEPEEDEEPGEEPAQDEEAQAKPPRRNGYKDKIAKLEHKLEHATRRTQDLEDELRRSWRPDRQSPQQQAQQPQQPAGPPRQEQFETYEDFIRADIRYQLQQELAQQRQEEQRAAAQRQQEQLLNGWHERVGRVRTELPDYHDTLDSVSHINIPPVLGHALMSSEDGPKLAYELARQPEVLEKIVRLEPLAQLRALGKFEASLTAAAPAQAAPPRRPVSQAPEPIRPVGQGAANGSTVPLDQRPLGEYIRERNRQEKARRSS